MKKLTLPLLIALQTVIVNAHATNHNESIQNQINKLKSQVGSLESNSSSSLNITSNKKAFGTIFSGGKSYTDKTTSIVEMISNNTIKEGENSIGGKIEGTTTADQNTPKSKDNTISKTSLAFQGQIGIISKPSNLFTTVLNFSAKDSGDRTLSTKQLYGVLGNLSYSPLYFIGGYKYIDFGYMARYSNKITNFNRLFNSINSAQAELGLIKNRLNIMLTAFNGNSDETYTSSNQVSNAAANISYTLTPLEQLTTKIGAGAIKAINNTGALVNGQQLMLTQKRSSAWDIYQTFEYDTSNKSKLTGYIEYVQASRNGYNNKKPSSLSSSIGYDFSLGGLDLNPSLSYSYLSGASIYYGDTPTMNNTSTINQYVASISTKLKGIKVGIDYGRLLISNASNDQVGILKAEYQF